MEDIILVGFGGHAKSVIDTLEQSSQFRIAGYTDLRPDRDCQNYQWLGTDDKLGEYYVAGFKKAAICIGFMGHSTIRDQLYSTVKKIGFELPAIIDRSAIIANHVQIGEGSYIGKGAIINVDSRIGKMCIINSGALVEHENDIGDYSHVAVKTTLCGNVHIGRHTFIGAGTTAIQGVRIGDGCIIGAGSVILGDIPSKKTVYGLYKG